MKLLIVDDNPHMRRLIIQIACRSGDAVFECDDGAGALAAYRQHLPDWVLMDIEMPETDGITATREIVSEFPEAKVIIVTDINHADLQARAKTAGALEYVNKENLADLRGLFAN